MKNLPNLSTAVRREVDVVLGAGGVKGFAHKGFWKALCERDIPIGTVTGASVGAIDAAFFTNGWTPEQVTDLYLQRLANRFNPLLLAKCVGMPDPLSFLIGGCTDLTLLLREMVKELGLRPNPRLRILAYDILNRKPVLFQGEDYDLGLALAASCAMPGVMMPVRHVVDGSTTLLVDGAIYHRNPAEFSQTPAIISRLGFATQPPQSWQLPIDLYFHLREMYFPILHQPSDVDESKHIVATTQAPDVAGLNFGISQERCLRLVDEGYAAANEAIDKAIASGRLPESTCSRT